MKANSLSQRQLSVLIGVSYQAINNWLMHITYPNMENLLSLAEAFHCEVPDLIEDAYCLDERKRYLTIGQAILLQNYGENRVFQQICDDLVKHCKDTRFLSYVLKWNELVSAAASEDAAEAE